MWCSIIISPFPFWKCARDFFLIRYRLLPFLPRLFHFTLFYLSFSFVRSFILFSLFLCVWEGFRSFHFRFSFSFLLFLRLVVCLLPHFQFSAYLRSWLIFSVALPPFVKHTLKFCFAKNFVARYASHYFQTEKETFWKTNKMPFTCMTHHTYDSSLTWFEIALFASLSNKLTHSKSVTFSIENQRMSFANATAVVPSLFSLLRLLLLLFSLEKKNFFANWIVLYCLKINVIRPICLLSAGGRVNAFTFTRLAYIWMSFINY